MKHNKNGFSLFELLVVISIIGILIAVMTVSFSAAQQKARDARRIQDMDIVQKAAEQYYANMSYAYPLSTSPAAWSVASIGQTLLPVFPTDPKGVGATQYIYQPTATGYCACARVEDPKNGNSTDNLCTFSSPSATTYFYCIKNQQ